MLSPMNGVSHSLFFLGKNRSHLIERTEREREQVRENELKPRGESHVRNMNKSLSLSMLIQSHWLQSETHTHAFHSIFFKSHKKILVPQHNHERGSVQAANDSQNGYNSKLIELFGTAVGSPLQ